MKHSYLMWFFWRSFVLITMGVLACACSPNETTRKDGRVHVAAGSYVDARLVLDENSTPWIIATREESERTVEIMSFDGQQKCTAATLHGDDVELLGSNGYSGDEQPFYLSILDSRDGVGTISFVRPDCTRAVLTLDDVRAPTLRIGGAGIGLSTANTSWLARTSNGDLHVLSPSSESMITIGSNVTGYTVLGATVWYLTDQELVGWSSTSGAEIARFGEQVSEASIGYGSAGYVILYVDNGDVFVTSNFGATPTATQLTTTGDVCDVDFLGGARLLVSWKSPCADNTLNVSTLDNEHPFEPFILPGPIGDAVYRDGQLHWVINPGTGDHALMTATIDETVGAAHRIGAGEDLGSIQVRPTLAGIDGSEEVDPESREFFVTLEAEDGSNVWGVWSVTNGFRQLEENVGTTRIFRFSDTRAELSVALISTNEENGSGDLNVRSTVTGEHIATVPNARIDTISVPFQSAAVALLQNWDASTSTGDLVGVGFDGTPLELERGVSMYTTIEIPLDALLYTIPFGDRRGVWLWIGGGPR